MSEQPAKAERTNRCDHICHLPDGHDGPHQYGYEIPSPRDAERRLHEAEQRVERLEAKVERVLRWWDHPGLVPEFNDVAQAIRSLAAPDTGSEG